MKTSFILFALVTALGAPVSFAAELAGNHLPRALQSENLFAGFVVTALLLTLVRDYARPVRMPSRVGVGRAVRGLKSAHPLAA